MTGSGSIRLIIAFLLWLASVVEKRGQASLAVMSSTQLNTRILSRNIDVGDLFRLGLIPSFYINNLLPSSCLKNPLHLSALGERASILSQPPPHSLLPLMTLALLKMLLFLAHLNPPLLTLFLISRKIKCHTTPASLSAGS